MRIFLLLLLMIFSTNVFAVDKLPKRIDKSRISKAEIKAYSIQKSLAEPKLPSETIFQNEPVQKASAVKAEVRTGDHFVNVKIDSSRNGFGWLNAGIRSIDRFKGVDASSIDTDFLLLAYRQYSLTNPATGILGATTIDVTNGLQNGDFYRHVKLNDYIAAGTVGARYPGVVALDRPFIAFNQYISGDANTSPAISHPYLITDYLSYGASGGLWTSPYLMDEGYHHHTFAENRLWSGSVSVVKSDDAMYHYAGVYRNWTITGESQPNEYVILNAETADPTDSWVIDTTPTLIDTLDFMIYPILSLNKSGFGALVGIGHQGPHAGDTFFMSELRAMVKFTTDYGKTWSGTRELSWAELGIPETITESDSIYVPASATDSTMVLYNGPAYLSIPNNHALDVIVSETNDVFIGFDLVWGPQAGENSYYRDWHYSGVHAAISNDGGENFHDTHIAINNGFFEGDSIAAEAGDNYVFNSEVELSLDDLGRLYATWLDRPGAKIEVAEHLRYDDPNGEILIKTDVFTSRTLDGGENWSWKMNVTNSVSIDEYELKAVRTAERWKDNGTIYFAYCTVDPNSSVAQGDPDAYTYRVNRVWVGEGFNYPDTDATGINDEVNNFIARQFELQQNYPNPFNPTTAISYQLSATSQVNLTVYNTLGQKIQTLVNKKQNSGVHQVSFNGAGLASGIYYYHLTVGANSSVRKMVLMK